MLNARASGRALGNGRTHLLSYSRFFRPAPSGGATLWRVVWCHRSFDASFPAVYRRLSVAESYWVASIYADLVAVSSPFGFPSACFSGFCDVPAQRRDRHGGSRRSDPQLRGVCPQGGEGWPVPGGRAHVPFGAASFIWRFDTVPRTGIVTSVLAAGVRWGRTRHDHGDEHLLWQRMEIRRLPNTSPRVGPPWPMPSTPGGSFARPERAYAAPHCFH